MTEKLRHRHIKAHLYSAAALHRLRTKDDAPKGGPKPPARGTLARMLTEGGHPRPRGATLPKA